jgi:hypothetical protein
MILVTSADEFAELQPTPNPKSDNQLGENLKHFFLVSPEVASGTGLHQRMKAKDIAFGIIRNLQKLSEATGVDPVNFTAEEMTHQELLAWLWVLASKKVQELTLTTPEESQRLDELTTEAKALLDGPQEITPTLPLERVEPARSAIEEVALMTATTKLYEQYYSSELKRADEKTLLHHLSTESQKLWKMTGAFTWEDEDPAPVGFAETFLAKRQPSTLRLLMNAEMKKFGLRGELTQNAFAEVFAHGHLSPDDVNPGGLSPFFCKPSSPVAHKDRKTLLLNTMKDMSDNNELEASILSHLSTSDMYIAMDIDSLEIQMETFVSGLLSMFVNPNGMIIAASQKILHQIRSKRVIIQNCFTTSPTFGARYAYRIDRIYHHFFSNLLLSDNINETSSADRAYLGMEIDEINRDLSLAGFLNNVALPLSITSKMTEASSKRPRDEAKPAATATTRKTTTPIATNSAVEPTWKIPKGKTYGDFFKGGPEASPHNKDWPKFPHHTSAKPGAMCIKYQSMGSCFANCTLSHILPTAMSAAEKKTVSDKFAKIYA